MPVHTAGIAHPGGAATAAATVAPVAAAGPLDGLATLSPADLERYRAAVAAGRQTGWGYYFPYLLTRNRPGRSALLVEEIAGSLCLYLWRAGDGRPRLDVYLPPLPMNAGALGLALERANAFNGDRSARILRIDAADAEAIAALPGLDVKRRKRQYVYAPGSYGDLRGKAYYTIRRNVAYVRALQDVEVVPYTPALEPGCRSLLARWRRQYRRRHGGAGGAGTSRRALELAGSGLPRDLLHGEVVLIDGNVAAFAFGGEIRPGVGCIFDTKCDSRVRGLAYFQRYRFITKLGMHGRVNDGSHTGRDGLKQFKDSFRPVEMHTEFRARQAARGRQADLP